MEYAITHKLRSKDLALLRRVAGRDDEWTEVAVFNAESSARMAMNALNNYKPPRKAKK